VIGDVSVKSYLVLHYRRACQEVCRSANEHIEKIIDMRRYLQMVGNTETGRDVVKNMRVRGNPWRGTMYGRTDWAEGPGSQIVGEDNNIGCPVLGWLHGSPGGPQPESCPGSGQIDETGRSELCILGEEEMCCGDPARRLGAEHIFQMLAMNNISFCRAIISRK
jgi:Fe-S oxidoreductase